MTVHDAHICSLSKMLLRCTLMTISPYAELDYTSIHLTFHYGKEEKHQIYSSLGVKIDLYILHLQFAH